MQMLVERPQMAVHHRRFPVLGLSRLRQAARQARHRRRRVRVRAGTREGGFSVTELSHAIVFLAEGCEGIAPELYAAARTNQHLSTCGAPSLDACDLCLYELGRLRAALAAAAPVIEAAERARLAGEGSLHPAGSEHRVQLLLRWYFPDGHTLDWGGDDMASVLALLGEPPEGQNWYEIRRREHWAGPWEVVPEEEINNG
jgi:hypothetical protein